MYEGDDAEAEEDITCDADAEADEDGADDAADDEGSGVLTPVVTPLPTAQGLTTKAAKALEKAEKSAIACLAADEAAAADEKAADEKPAEGERAEGRGYSVTHKKDYKKFYLECRNRKKFPASLASEANRDSMNLFKIWLGKKGSWTTISADTLTKSMPAGIGITVVHISALSEMPKLMCKVSRLRPGSQDAQMFVRVRRLEQSCGGSPPGPFQAAVLA